MKRLLTVLLPAIAILSPTWAIADPSPDPPDYCWRESPVAQDGAWIDAAVAEGSECWYCGLENMRHRYWPDYGHYWAWVEQPGWPSYIEVRLANGAAIPAGAEVVVAVESYIRQPWEGWVEWPDGTRDEIAACEKAGELYGSYTRLYAPCDASSLRIQPPAARWYYAPKASFSRIDSLWVQWRDPYQRPGDEGRAPDPPPPADVPPGRVWP